MYIHDYFMLLFDLTPDQADSEEHVSPPTNGHIRRELKFSEPLPEAPIAYYILSMIVQCV
jgi:hypothetical protein